MPSQRCNTFDVTALYTSIPVADVIEVIKRRLEQDTELPRRTTWSPDNILKLLELPHLNDIFDCGFHLPQTNKKVAITSATMAKNISHDTTT